MMRLAKRKAQELIRSHHTRDPSELADILNYNVIRYTFSERIKGLALQIEGETVIGLNSSYPEEEKQTLSHELGHAVLHEEMGLYRIRGHTFYPEGKLEREADLFAATLLLEEPIAYGETVDEYAARSGVPPELVKVYMGIK